MRSLLTWTTALLLGLSAPSLALAGGKGNSSGKGSGTSHYSPGYQHGSGPKYVSPYHPSVDKYRDSKSDKYRDYRSDKYHDIRGDYYEDHHLRHGRNFGTDGYLFSGKYHDYWQYRYFDRNFGWYLYSWPGTYSWYYVSVPSCCYYPVWTLPYLAYFWGAPMGY